MTLQEPNKETHLHLRINEAEKQAFARIASLTGLSLSAWVRTRLRMLAIKELKEFDETPAFME